MRLGLLSDVHGNVWALQAVLEHAASRGVETWLNLGDALYGPLAPAKTDDLLETLGAATIQGNEDRRIHEASPAEVENNATLGHVWRELGPERIARLRALPASLWLGNEVYACHGAPSDDTQYLLEDVSAGYPVLRPFPEIEKLLGSVRAEVVLCGHTHIPRIVELAGGQLVVNPGSVGLPAYDDETPNYHRMETFTSCASYAIIEKRHGGWSVEQYAVPYDRRTAVRRARLLGRADWAHWLDTGRCRPCA